jgi:Ca-activated chloride channel family protein
VALLVLAVVALARPQAGERQEEITSEGVDVMLLLDRSGSMMAMDMEPDRLGKAKEIMDRFIEGRPADRIGLAAFAQTAYTVCPLTLDHPVLRTVLGGTEIAPPDESATAIGLGLAAAINRLLESPARSRVAVLVTDGVNNAGSIDPLTAADLAAREGVKVYTVGVGTHGYAPLPRLDRRGRPLRDRAGRVATRPMRVVIDEEVLREVARRTGGLYFRATDAKTLEKTFARIDSMEKTEVSSTHWIAWDDLYRWFLLPAAGLLALELLLSAVILRRLP